jgi:hypothetical protein
MWCKSRLIPALEFFFYRILFPHLGQNFALIFTEDPQELHGDPLDKLCFGKSAGSGGGKTPGVEKAAAAEMIEGGCPGPGKVDPVTCDACDPIPGGIGLAIVEPEVRPLDILSSDFLSSKITLTDRNSNEEYDTT